MFIARILEAIENLRKSNKVEKEEEDSEEEKAVEEDIEDQQAFALETEELQVILFLMETKQKDL